MSNKVNAEAKVKSEEFIIEAIVGKRLKKKYVEYLVQWKGFGPEANTWEPKRRLAHCSLLIDSFERKWKEDNLRKNQRKGPQKRSREGCNSGTGGQPTEKMKEAAAKPSRGGGLPEGFDRGMRPEAILGITQVLGENMFLVKWFGSEIKDLVPSKVANLRCPQLVIAYYEKNLVWN